MASARSLAPANPRDQGIQPACLCLLPCPRCPDAVCTLLLGQQDSSKHTPQWDRAGSGAGATVVGVEGKPQPAVTCLHPRHNTLRLQVPLGKLRPGQVEELACPLPGEGSSGCQAWILST